MEPMVDPLMMGIANNRHRGRLTMRTMDPMVDPLMVSIANNGVEGQRMDTKHYINTHLTALPTYL